MIDLIAMEEQAEQEIVRISKEIQRLQNEEDELRKERDFWQRMKWGADGLRNLNMEFEEHASKQQSETKKP